jgi:PAS domain S-box-containing protein
MNTPLNILLLEDDINDALLARKALQDSGVRAEVQTVSSEADFTNALSQKSFDVVLSDYKLPGYDGLAALEHVKAHYPALPFIFVSGCIGEDAAIELLKKGAADFVLKNRFGRLGLAVSRAMDQVHRQMERQKAQEELSESRKRFEQIAEHVGEWIWEVDAEGLYTYSNDVVERILGYRAGELVQKLHFYDLYPTDQRKALKTAAFEHFNKELPFVKYLNACQHKNGEVLVLETSGTPIFDSQHKFLGYCGVDTNMTEHKRMEAEMLRSQRLESIGRLAGGIAHDLNNVLAPIIMAVPLLREENDGESRRPLLDIIESNARRGAEIIRQVLTFAKGAEIQQTVVQPAFLLEEIAKIISETFPKSIELRMKVAPHLVQINGDPTQLHQVLLNLCVNARDAMPRGGVLTLTAENVDLDQFPAASTSQTTKTADKYVLITVADTGMGIPEENLPRIFDPFFSTKEPHSGTGLGLSSVLGIVKSHSGFIQVHSQPGQGTQFKIYLPVETSKHQVLSKEESQALPAAKGETILVVDDEPNVLDVLRKILERQGYRVLSASDGTEAITLYARHGTTIKVVITDMLMPIMDGAATIRALRKMNPDVKVIAVSGMVPQPGLGDFSTLGVKVFLRKPFTNQVLLKTVRDVLALL